VTISQLDHLVLTARSIPETCAFYTQVLGFGLTEFAGGRKALTFGNQKINLHQAGSEFLPCAGLPTPGSLDLCFISETPLEVVIAELKTHGVPIEEGPVQTTGAIGILTSIYLRDPDQNLIEISNYVP
jgi:catechol 2,3-dioxygenase-like lactoylglutathione lyase family enzyme